jgi:hypothetical protein
VARQDLAGGGAASRPAHSLAGTRSDQGVFPVAEGARELHDVALVHQRHALALVLDGVVEGGADCRSLPAETGLMPMPDVAGKWIFLTPISFWRN